MFTLLTPEQLMNQSIKEIFNYIQVVSICVTWARFLSFFLVIESISKLILTLLKMIVEALTFILVTTSYLYLMIPIFQLLFQE